MGVIQVSKDVKGSKQFCKIFKQISLKSELNFKREREREGLINKTQQGPEYIYTISFVFAKA